MPPARPPAALEKTLLTGLARTISPICPAVAGGASVWLGQALLSSPPARSIKKRTRTRIACACFGRTSRPVHFAGGLHYRIFGFDAAVGLESIAGALHIIPDFLAVHLDVS